MMEHLKWSGAEKQVAKRAFNAALEREYAELMHQTRERVGAMQEGDDLWRLHDFLTDQRRKIDDKYDYRYSQLVVVFARLIHEGRLSLDELEGLHEDKLEKIRAILSLARR
ncbi:MAG: hypothetical protein FJ280_20650 [Planctomycetes bacterium]|nr:hypothetical protein [Planctomycetota bacterium]